MDGPSNQSHNLHAKKATKDAPPSGGYGLRGFYLYKLKYGFAFGRCPRFEDPSFLPCAPIPNLRFLVKGERLLVCRFVARDSN